MDANTIREKIHALKLDKSWRGTATKFLQHYESQILLLESIMDDHALLWPERTKMIMLELAVKSNKDLATLMTVEHLDIAKGRAPITFPQYISILKSRAHELDAEDGNSSRGGRSRYQSIHQSEQGGAGREGRGGRGGRGSRDGRGRGRGRGGRG